MDNRFWNLTQGVIQLFASAVLFCPGMAKIPTEEGNSDVHPHLCQQPPITPLFQGSGDFDNVPFLLQTSH